MDPITDFSAAPHMPPSLREHIHGATLRPELALGAIASGVQNVVVMERNGELYVAFAQAVCGGGRRLKSPRSAPASHPRSTRQR